MADPTTDDVTAGELLVEQMAHVLWECDGYEDSRMWEQFGPHYLDRAAAILASRAFARRDARVRAEALREAADPILLDHATCSCGLRVLDHDIGGCRTIAADALAEWLRERADRIERGESR